MSQLAVAVLFVALGPTVKATLVPAAPSGLHATRDEVIQHGQLRHNIHVKGGDVEPAQLGQPVFHQRHESVLQSLVHKITNVFVPELDMPARRQGMYFRPVSVTLYCVMTLTIVSLLLQTSLSISRNSEELAGQIEPTLLTQTLAAASRTIAYPRMICILFVSCRMYVLATTEGLGEPQPWVKTCMIVSTTGLLVQMAYVLAIPFFTLRDGAVAHFDALAGEPFDSHVMLQPQMFKFEGARHIFQGVQFLTIICVYGGACGVIIGVFTFPAEITKVSAAVLCTVLLTILYLLVWFLQWLSNHWLQFSPPSLKSGRARQAGLQAVFSARKAPCLAVLFLAARMRALQLDPPLGIPSFWVQISFLVVTASFFAETIVGVYIGANGDEQLSSVSVSTFRAGKVAHILSAMFSGIVYLGLIPIYGGIFQMRDQAGSRAPLSATLTATFQLTFMYFFVQLLQWFLFMLRDVFLMDWKKMQSTVLSAEVSLRFVPMLCLLFISCRMRALQITKQLGAPPVWAQQCMYLCVLATSIQSLSCLVLPLLLEEAESAAKELEVEARTPTKPRMKVDADGMPAYLLTPMWSAYAVAFLKYVALFCLNGGALGVCLSVFTMSPETAYFGDGPIISRAMYPQTLETIVLVFLLCLLLSSAKVLGILVKVAIEALDEQLLGTEITIDSVAISLCRVYVNIKRLEVRNPPYVDKKTNSANASNLEGDWVSSCILKMDSLVLKVNTWLLIKSLGRELEITTLKLKGVEINFELPWGTTSNVGRILDHLKAQEETTDQDKADAHKSAIEETKMVTREIKVQAADGAAADVAQVKEPYTKVIVKAINIKDIAANAQIGGPMSLGAMMSFPLADLQFPDFDEQTHGLETKAVVAVVAKFVVKTLLKTVVSNVTDRVGMGFANYINSKANSAMTTCCLPQRAAAEEC